jgi:flagellar motor component MotA
MNPLSRLLGITFSLAALAATILPSTSLGSYLSVPSFLLVAGLVVGGLMASFGPRSTLRALRQALESAPLPDRDVTDSLRLARHGYHLSWAAGGVGVLVGIVNVLTNIADPSQLGWGLSLALLSLLYGALLAELVFANAIQWLRREARVEVA